MLILYGMKSGYRTLPVEQYAKKKIWSWIPFELALEIWLNILEDIDTT